MNRKRSILLTAGAVLAASLISNATTIEAFGSSPIKPAAHKCAPDAHEDKCAPDAQESAPDSQETAPDAQESAPDAHEAAPVAQGSAPDAHETAPASHESAPAAFGSAPAAFGSAPAAFGSAPASFQGSPASHAIAPTSHAALPRSPGSSPSPASVAPQSNQPNTVLTPSGLAVADTVFSYCGQIDHSSASSYQAGLNMITQGHSSGEAAAIRMTPEYAKTQAALNAQLVKVSFVAGISACRSFASNNNDNDRHIGHPVSSPVKIPQLNGFLDR